MIYPIPDKVFDQHAVAVGKTGAGKSYALRSMIEHLLDKEKRVCIIDPKGDHYGIKSSADGKKPGYPLVLFGDFKVQVTNRMPIHSRAGKEIAELVATGNRPCVIGFRGWMPADRTRFWIDFASTLFNLNNSPLYLPIDEIQNFAPQGKIPDPDMGKCLHWTNRLASEGRGNGITILMASQRPQKVHKDTLTCAETLIAMRVTHPLDRAAVKDWVDGCGDPERGKEVMNSLAQMQTGEAYVWSPEIGFFERLKFPRIKTFDSFKAPTGIEKRQQLSGWADVDMKEIEVKLQKVKEENEANDPAILKKKLREAESKLRQMKPQGPSEAEKARAMESAMERVRNEMTRHFNAQMKSAYDAIDKHQRLLKRIADLCVTNAIEIPKQTEIKLPDLMGQRPSSIRGATLGKIKPPIYKVDESRSESVSTDVKIDAGALRMLAAVVKFSDQGLTRSQAKSYAGIKTMQTFYSYNVRLRKAGLWEERDGLIFPTEKGIDVVGKENIVTPTTTEEVVATWGPHLDAGARRILQYLVEMKGEFVEREEVMKRCGIRTKQTMYSYGVRLKAAQLIIVRGSQVAANKETLFL